MLHRLTFVVFVCTALASNQPQKIINHHDLPGNFIQSSIFAKNLVESSLPHPVTLPPSYQSRDFDIEDAFGGIGTFAHLEFTDCTNSDSSGTFDIGIVGHPFDLGVSYRPGARFGPNGARQERGGSPLLVVGSKSRVAVGGNEG